MCISVASLDATICVFLSALHGASSGCGWRNGFQFGGQRRIYSISSVGQPTRGGPPVSTLDEVLTTLHGINLRCYERFHMVSVGRCLRPGTNLRVTKNAGNFSINCGPGSVSGRALHVSASDEAIIVINTFQIQKTIKIQGLSLVLQT